MRATRIAGAALNALRDLRYGRVLGGTIRSRYPEVGAFHVTNSEYRDLPHLFAAADASADDVFVDVGCGKGRVLNWLLSRFPRAAIYGLELDPEVCRATAQRLRRHANVEVRCGDGPTLLPRDATVFYLFNPFDDTVMRRFIDAVRRLDPPRGGRPRRVVYYNAKYVELFVAQGWEVRTVALPSNSQPSVVITVTA